MSREINSDFASLKQFIGEYSLNHLINEPDFTLAIKKQHKKYFSYLVCIAELQSYVDEVDYSNMINKMIIRNHPTNN
ncbi:hypothetical protein EZS27_041903 [termite gut metagenome]|uniref:Uncharacterized protein n=1 Tax=termite gut metagenome TaxID=433724 RepID=A0A5J4PCN9_9ZZZZ